MKEAQLNFDRAGQKVCPQQLTAPVLHKVLNYEGIEPYIWGGKGVGAGGDGTAQFLCRDEHAQSQVKTILEQDLKVDVMLLTIEASSKVRKAVLPAAGFGADLFPATKCVCPPLFPVVDKDGIAKPAILLTVQELVEAGIEEIIIIVQQMDLSVYENLFVTPIPKENFERLSPENKILAKEILQIGERVKFVVQEKQDGFGNAVFLSFHRIAGMCPVSYIEIRDTDAATPSHGFYSERLSLSINTAEDSNREGRPATIG